uniref:mTERF domain-containing protein 1, mitochondrial n=1 Tax=Anthurium amnicola TaxID=1678845 RepID=A0A1D1Y2V5_9ARAE
MRIPVSLSSSSCNLLRFLLRAGSRPFSSAADDPTILRRLKNVPYRHRARALREAQHAVTEYLHATRSLHFSHAEHIAANSPTCLSSLLSRLPFPHNASDLPRALRRSLYFLPINEFDFFFESIGAPPPPAPRPGGLFLSEDTRLVSAVSALVHFGFPWTKLGVLYGKESSIFSRDANELASLLGWYQSLGFDKVAVIGICLAFPSVLASGNGSSSDREIASLFEDMKRVTSDFHPEGSAEENVDTYFHLCRRIRVFYDLGCEKGSMGEFLAASREELLKLEVEDLIKKVDFFCRLGMNKEEAGLFVLQCPEVLQFDLESPMLRMPDYLGQIGLSREDLDSIPHKYPYVMGKNRVENLPSMLRAMDLNEWFVHEIRNGRHHYLSPAFVVCDSEERVVDIDFRDELKKAMAATKIQFVTNKLEFLLGIGFGENKVTAKALQLVNGTQNQLKKRFCCLLAMGINYSMLCRMVSATPKLLNQNVDMLRVKVNHLCNDLGCSLQYLNNFPAYLCFDLENRVKPRYRILDWLKEKGLLKRHFAPATILATSEKKFMGYLIEIHPAAPKQWLEVFSSKKYHSRQ